MKTKNFKSLAIIIGFPIIYILYIISPIGEKLFVEKNFDYYIPFWSGIVLLHWLSVFFVIKELKSQGENLRSIGYQLSKKRALLFVSVFLLTALLVVGITEWMLQDVTLDKSQLDKIPSLIPKSTGQRIFFIFLVFSTGFCEEIVYRGFAITKLKNVGINKWLAIGISSFLFVGIHGINGYLYRFPFLFIGGVIFGLIFLWKGRLLNSMVIHLIINLSATMAILQLLY